MAPVPDGDWGPTLGLGGDQVVWGLSSVRATYRTRPASGWAGPIFLGAYLFWQFHIAFGSRAGEFVWLTLVTLFAAEMLLWHRRRFSSIALMALEVLAGALVNDVAYSLGGGLRDLRLYLGAGSSFLAGGPIYAVEPIHRYPSDLASLPFLYPPPTLPIFGLLSALPLPIASAFWVAGSVAAVVLSLRLLGLQWRWTIVALLWPPIEQGLFVGNVAAPSFLLLAMAPRIAGTLVVGPLLKPQNGIMALWLVRERAWRQLILVVGMVLAIALLTLPFTGIGLWADWVKGLLAYQESQTFLPGLYGVGLGRYLPFWVFVLVAAFVVGLALVASGRECLSRLGLASAVASPSLWSHGFLVAIPAFLRLRASLCWLVLGLLCAGEFPGPQLALAVPVVVWVAGRLWPRLGVRGTAMPGELHPLGPCVEPWPQLSGAQETLRRAQPPTRGSQADGSDAAIGEASLGRR